MLITMPTRTWTIISPDKITRLITTLARQANRQSMIQLSTNVENARPHSLLKINFIDILAMQARADAPVGRPTPGR